MPTWGKVGAAIPVVAATLTIVVYSQQLLGREGTPVSTGVPSTSPTPHGEGSLELRGDGLGEVRFGDDLSLAVAILTEVFGSADNDAETFCESGSDKLVFWDELYIVGDDGDFAGWVYHPDLDEPPPVTLRSPSGVEIGTTLAELYALFENDVTVITDTSLTHDIAGDSIAEFGIIDAVGKPEDGMSGFLTGDDRGDVVTKLRGGDGCYFR